MDYESKYNTKAPGVKRLMREALENKQATEELFTQPLDDNLFEWHFTIRGATSTAFEGGIYHGRIIFPSDYPMKPPNIILLTPNGRFEINKKICLSISGHHPETWQPSWSIRTALLALIAFMPSHGKGTLGSLYYTDEERRILAKKSQNWECPNCGPIGKLLGKITTTITTDESDLIKNFQFKPEVTTQKTEERSISETSESINSAEVTNGNQSITTSSNNSNADTNIPSEGFYIGEKTSNILIAFVIVALALLFYRRLYLIQA